MKKYLLKLYIREPDGGVIVNQLYLRHTIRTRNEHKAIEVFYDVYISVDCEYGELIEEFDGKQIFIDSFGNKPF